MAAATAVGELHKSSWGPEAIRTEERQRGEIQAETERKSEKEIQRRRERRWRRKQGKRV